MSGVDPAQLGYADAAACEPLERHHPRCPDNGGVDLATPSHHLEVSAEPREGLDQGAEARRACFQYAVRALGVVPAVAERPR